MDVCELEVKDKVIELDEKGVSIKDISGLTGLGVYDVCIILYTKYNKDKMGG